MTPRFRITSALGIVQILTWGSSFYLLAVLGPAITAQSGWSAPAVTGGVSLALLISGVSAGPVGRAIKSRGGRPVMVGGVLTLVVGLVVLSLAHSLPVYYIAWAVMGAGMAATLYEAAFSTLGTVFGRDARRAITVLTLWGGFASTLCWPLSAWMVEMIGWRGACLGYAGLHLLVTAPLCAWAIPAKSIEETPIAKEKEPAAPVLDPRFLLLALAGISLASVFSIMSIHLISLLTAGGLSLAAAVGLGALIGPAQVGARVLEWLGKERHHPVVTLCVAALMVLSGIVALSLGWSAAGALIAYGVGTGLYSIARGTVPLAVFGPENYPVMMGRLALPILLTSAVAPLIGAGLIDSVGASATFWVLMGLALMPVIAGTVLALLLRRVG